MVEVVRAHRTDDLRTTNRTLLPLDFEMMPALQLASWARMVGCLEEVCGEALV